jgi:uncharacterized surface protein with fasciclin (FAS1) repeats
MLLASVFAIPFVGAAGGVQAADLVQTLKEQDQFSTLVGAVEKAGIASSLEGEGPFTLFAPTNQAFEQLPEDARSQLMSDKNQEELKSLLENHVIEGRAISASEVQGSSTEVDTLAGDQLTVDGQHDALIVIPTGLQLTQIGDRMYVQREAAVATVPAVEVRLPTDQGGSSSQGGSGQQSSDSQTQNQQSGTDQQASSSGQQSSGSNSGGQDQQMASSSGSSSSSSSASEEQGRSALRHAMVVEAGIEADNGVIHAIDAVLVPQKVMSSLEPEGGQQDSGQSQQSN